MSWIRELGEDAAEGALAEAYGDIKGRRGKVANIMRVHSLNPAAMTAHMDLYLTLMFGRSAIPRPTRELVAVIVSKANGCDYCVRHHREALAHYWKDDLRIERALDDYHSARLTPREVAMLDYAVKLTTRPSEMKERDIAELRANGLDDSEILDLNLIVNYFNFVNRIALGLGVEDSAAELQGYEY